MTVDEERRYALSRELDPLREDIRELRVLLEQHNTRLVAIGIPLAAIPLAIELLHWMAH